MAHNLRIHFAVAGTVAPAKHHVSGVIPLQNGPAPALGAGMISVAACDEKLIFDEFNLASDRPYAIACNDCVETDVWKEAIKKDPHPSWVRASQGTDDVSEAMEQARKGCC